MTHKFTKHYTRDEARALLPRIRQWLAELAELRNVAEEYDKRLAQMLANGSDVGGDPVHQWIKALAGVKTVLREFQSREIQIKDLDRGLLDFPAFIGDQEVFLCWEKDEEDIEYWHDLSSGYAGRERL
jgi:hypothetical protein